ncbi:hypothetical protein [Pedobacter sp. N23S346]|uniref:hypothetical protein n=1 Tax=Pedobacter sp. N23S346 TaxID=3402750 RepID=UPI003AC82A4A
MNKHLLLSLTGLILSISVSFAQQKVKDGTITGTNLPNKDAILELESNDKGFLHVRIALVATINPAPLTAHVAGMMVYNTATSADVTPGIYYNDGTKWVKNAAGVAGPKGDKGDAGLTGPQGIQGLKGDAGPIGLSGPKGDTGATGLVGPQGIQGLKGDAGPIGVIGPKGDTGATGLTGSAGVTGDKGDKGDSGAQGIQGLKGDKGDVGATGPQGATGIAGSQGIQGLKGDTGDKGDKGDVGATGPQGATGITGSQGIQGLKGDTGDKGDKGDIGATGPQGATGITGSQGIQGLKGDTGDKGDKGDIGATGPQGVIGTPGVQGIQGLKGDTGDKGDKGDVGATGVTGSQGIQGLKGDTGDKGDKGDVGATGTQGATGITGSQGIQGLKGDTGDKGDKGDIGATGATGSQGIQGLKGDTGDKGDVGATGVTGSQGIQGLKGDTGDKGDVGATGPAGASTPQTITHTLSSVDNTLTSDVNGTAPTAKLINSNVLGLDATNNLTSTINGVLSNAVDLSLLSVEPWNVQGTTNKATANNENIYQTGTVAIGRNTVLTGTTLDIAGAVRGGTGNTGTVGTNSVAFGERNIVSGANSVAFGYGNNISGIRNAAFGSVNVISEANTTSNFISGVSNEIRNGSQEAAIFGRSNIISATATAAPNFIMGSNSTINGGLMSFITGTYNVVEATGDHVFMGGISGTAKGRFNTIFGNQNIAGSYFETAVGSKSAITTGTPDKWVTTDVLLQVGNGDNAFAAPRNNAMTILKNAHTAIGLTGTEAAAKPTELLDLGGAATTGNGGLRIRNINSAAYAGAATDNLVVADANGILKTVTSSTLTTEPFQVESTTTKATTNTQNIYQNGNVGIGDFSASNPLTNLDVRGAIRGGTGNLGTIGTNSATFGTGNTASGNNSFATGLSSTASGVASTAMGEGSTASGVQSFAAGYHSNATNIATVAFGYRNNANGQSAATFGGYLTAQSQNELVIGHNNAIKIGTPNDWLYDEPVFQIGVGIGDQVANQPFGNAMTVLKNGNIAVGIINTNAALVTEAAAKPTERFDIGSGNVRVRDINTVTGSSTDKIVVADANGVLKTVTFAMNTTNIVNIATAYTALADDYTIIADAETAGFTLTIPAAAPTNKGRILVIRKIDESSNDITFSQSIKISKTVTITNLNINSTMRIQSDGTNWYKID